MREMKRAALVLSLLAAGACGGSPGSPRPNSTEQPGTDDSGDVDNATRRDVGAAADTRAEADVAAQEASSLEPDAQGNVVLPDADVTRVDGSVPDTSMPIGEFPLAAVKAARPTRVASLSTHVEGPSWRDGDVFFAADNIGLMRLTEGGQLYKYHPTLAPVGSYTLADGTLLICEKKHIVVQMFRDGSIGVIVGAGRGAGFCNDITVDGSGFIYFTDARANTIYRVSPMGDMVRVAGGSQFNYPNGLEVDPVSKYLYFSSGGLWRVQLPKEGNNFPMPERAGGPDADGMAFDIWGNLWLARVAAGTLAIFDPARRSVVAEISAGGSGVTNLTFGGAGRDTIYATLSGKGVWRIPVGARGFLHPVAPKYAIREMLTVKPADELVR